MKAILGALASIAAAMAADAAARTLKRVAWFALAAIFILIGLGFAAGAGYDELALQFGPRLAKLIFAAGFLVIGIIIAISVQVSTRRPTRRRSEEGGDATTAAIAFAMGLLGGAGRRR